MDSINAVYLKYYFETISRSENGTELKYIYSYNIVKRRAEYSAFSLAFV
jgi:hypothetical protein